MGTYAVGTAALNVLSGIPVRTGKARSGALHRTGVPVLAGSLEAETFEETFFQVPARGEPDRMLRAARKALDAGKRLMREFRAGTRTLSASERLLTRLTASAVRVYEELTTLARLNKGRVYPSYDHLVEATGLGRSTVRRALAALEAIGFLIRQRRFKRMAGEGAGPRYEQTSNAYRLLLPKSVLGYMPRWMRPAPLPVDEEWRRQEEAGEAARMAAALPNYEFARLTVGGEMGRVLARLGASMDAREAERIDANNAAIAAIPRFAEREVHFEPETLTHSIYNRT
jgi:DNA-binding transcriptional ArsR family regulator